MFRLIKDVRVKRISADVLNLKETKRNAGHSKWANIKHTKAEKDAQKSVTFHKMSRLIRLAIQGKYHYRKLQQINLSTGYDYTAVEKTGAAKPPAS
jgi:hypothetical protein